MDTSFGDIQSFRELFAQLDIGILILFEDLIEQFDLIFGEDGALPTTATCGWSYEVGA